MKNVQAVRKYSNVLRAATCRSISLMILSKNPFFNFSDQHNKECNKILDDHSRLKICLQFDSVFSNFSPLWRGGVAQLGERCVRNAQVRGSIPLTSTTCDLLLVFVPVPRRDFCSPFPLCFPYAWAPVSFSKMAGVQRRFGGVTYRFEIRGLAGKIG